MKLILLIVVVLAVLSVLNALDAVRQSDVAPNIPTRERILQHYSSTERALDAIGEGLSK